MRKVMLLAAMLAMVLAAAVPAFAQDVTFEGDDVEYNGICQNIIGQVNTTTTQTGNANATAMAEDDAAAIAEVAQDAGVSIEQANECFNQADLDGDGVLTVVELEKFGVVTAAAVQYATASPTPLAELPETGGASVIALGAGALLVAGGLLARRIVR